MTGMMNLDTDKLTEIAQAALAKVTDSKRWQNAITRAQSLLLDSPFWHVTDEGTLLLLSPDSSELYETDGVRAHRGRESRRVQGIRRRDGLQTSRGASSLDAIRSESLMRRLTSAGTPASLPLIHS
jgi:hypothetical protein